MEDALLWEVPYLFSVYFWEVPFYGKHLFIGGAPLWEVPLYERCPFLGGAPLQMVPLNEKRPLMADAPLWEVSLYGKFPSMEGIGVQGPSDLGKRWLSCPKKLRNVQKGGGWNRDENADVHHFPI